MTVFVPRHTLNGYSPLRPPMFADRDEALKWIDGLPHGNAFWVVDSETVWDTNAQYREYWVRPGKVGP